MAEYIKFRLTAAKVGVSMALMALIAGIAEKVQSSPAQVPARPAAQLLTLNNLNGGTRKAFLKIEDKLLSFEAKVHRNFYNKAQVNAEFLKKADAAAEFLNKADASAEFLKKADTASNSALLGNLPAGAFFQGHGNVVSGAQTIGGTGGSQQLLQTPDGAISILIGLSQPQPGGAPVPTVTIRNNTGALLPAVQDLGGSGGSSTKSLSLAPGDNTITLQGGASQLHLQTFPGSGGGFNSIIAILVSLEPNPSNGNQYLASGQMLDGSA